MAPKGALENHHFKGHGLEFAWRMIYEYHNLENGLWKLNLGHFDELPHGPQGYIAQANS